jgi:hypothetical protein
MSPKSMKNPSIQKLVVDYGAVGCLLLVHVKSDVGSRVILPRSKRRDIIL